MKIKKFNESIRDQMKPKSEDDIKASLLKLTPYGMLNKIISAELDDISEIEKFAQERIAKSLEELDELIEQPNRILCKIVDNVSNWVNKYGGNSENILGYGFKELSEQIVGYGFQDRHDSFVIYDESVFNSFKELLKNFAICEVQNNNIDYEK